MKKKKSEEKFLRVLTSTAKNVAKGGTPPYILKNIYTFWYVI